MKKTGISRETVERAARVYRTATDAALALGCSKQTFLRLCERFAIEAPAERRRRWTEESETDLT